MSTYTCLRSAMEAPQDEFEPDDDWKVGLKERVKSTITALITDAKNRQLTELRNEVVTLGDRNRVAHYKQAMEDIRKLEKELYETELEKERNQRRWIAGAPTSPVWKQYIVAEQERILNSIREGADQPSITSIQDPGISNITEQYSLQNIPEYIPARIPSHSSSSSTHSLGLPHHSANYHPKDTDREGIKKVDVSLQRTMVKLHAEALRAIQEANLAGDDAERLEQDVQMMEQQANAKRQEAREKKEEARMKQQFAQQKVAEMETLARRQEDEAKRREAEILQREQEAKVRAAEAKKLEDDAKRKENELRRKEEATRKREEKREESEQIKKQESEKIAEKAKKEQMRLLQLQEDTRKRAEEIQEREKALYLRELEVRRREEDAHRKEVDVKKMEEEAQKREAEAKHREDVAKLRKCQAAARKLEESRKTQELKREETHKRDEALVAERAAQEANERDAALRQQRAEGNRKVEELVADERRQQERQRNGDATNGGDPWGFQESDFELPEDFFENPDIVQEQGYIWQQLQFKNQADTIQRKRQEELWSFIPPSTSLSHGPSTSKPTPQSSQLPHPFSDPSSSESPSDTQSSSLSLSASTSSPGPRMWRPSQSTQVSSPFTTTPSTHMKNGASSPSGPMPFTRSMSAVPNLPASIRSAWIPQPPTPLPKATPNVPISGQLHTISASSSAYPSGVAYVGSEGRKRLQEQFIKDQQENFQRQQQKLDANKVDSPTTPTRSAVPSQSSNSVLVRGASVSSASQSALGHGTSRVSPVLEHEPYLFARPPSRNISNTVSPSLGVTPSIWSKSTKPALLADEDQDTIVAGNRKGKEPQRQEDRYSGWKPGVTESLSKEELELIAAHRRQMKSAASRPGKWETENHLKHEQKRKGPSVTIEVVSDEDMDDHNGDTLSINAPIILENATPKMHHVRR